MRWLMLVGTLGLLAGCGPEMSEEQSVQAQGAPESWCRSYKTQQYCPKNVCAWHSSPAPGYCGTPLTE